MAEKEDGAESSGEEAEGGGVPLPAPTPTSYASSSKPETLTSRESDPRRLGMQRARHREMVRQAARRGVAFGFSVGEGGRRRIVEAVQGGRVVESSFAKGEWGVRWKE